MEVSPVHDFLGNLIEKYPQYFIKLGKIENWWQLENISEIKIIKPLYVSGLARSGTTILLEKLNEHPDTASHQYRDFPLVHIPVSWNWFLNRATNHSYDKVERAHKDGIFITPDSPEAMEEILWMAFFPHCHQPLKTNTMDNSIENTDFETFYPEHVKKIIYIRNAKRYLAKGNYNISRIEYILKLFPDAKFIITIRNPLRHIASLMKQQKLFCDFESKDEKVLNYMRRVGHFEFGLDRRPINMGNNDIINNIQSLWKNNKEVEGWAFYWTYIYDTVFQLITSNNKVSSQVLFIHYSDICNNPVKTLNKIYDHCELEINQEFIDNQADSLKAPNYPLPFTEDEIELINNTCNKVLNKYECFKL